MEVRGHAPANRGGPSSLQAQRNTPALSCVAPEAGATVWHVSGTTANTQQSFGRYLLGGRIGHGAMGEVFRARLIGPAGPDEVVALKRLSADAETRDPDAVRRFMGEGHLGALLLHPNVVRILDVGEVSGTPYLAMELVDGCTVAQLRNVHGRLAAGPLLDIACQTALGLAALHDLSMGSDGRATLVHRDIKPANLLVDRAGCVKIADFGVALLAGAREITSVMGTLGYMSPEHARGEPLDGRTDLFSLGATVYALATGRHLVSTRSLAPMMDDLDALEALLGDPDNFAEVDELLPGLGPVLIRCLQPRRQDRYADGHALWADLSPLAPRVSRKNSLQVLVAQAAPQRPVHPSAEDDPTVLASVVGGRRVQLVGRNTELRRLRVLAARPGITRVTGPPGIGKSALVRAALPQALWLDAEACRTADQLRTALRQALGSPCADEPAVLLRRVGASGVVIDGLGHHDTELTALLERWTQTTPDRPWVLTTTLEGRVGGQALRLGPLTETASRELIAQHAPDAHDDRVQRVVDQMAGIPAALELAARDLVANPDDLPTTRLLEAERGIRLALEWTLRRLSRVQRDLLAQLSVFAGPAHLDDVTAVLVYKDPRRPLGLELGTLEERGLLQVKGARLQLSSVVRESAELLLTDLLGSAGRQALRMRHARRFATMGSEVALRAVEGPGAREAIDRLASAEADLKQALAAALELGLADDAADACAALYALAEAGRSLRPADPTFQAVVTQPDISPVQRLRLRLRRIRCDRVDTISQALRHAEIARTEARDHPELLGLSCALLADALVTVNRHDEARPHLAEALRHARARPDRRVEAAALRTLARSLSRQGQHEDALRHLEVAALLARSIADPVLGASIRMLQGLAICRMGRGREAAPLLRESARMSESLGQVSVAGRAWYNLAWALRRDDWRLVVEALDQSARLLDIGGDQRTAALSRLDRAQCFGERGRTEEAARLIDEVEADARLMGNEPILTQALCNRLTNLVYQRELAAADHLMPEILERTAALHHRRFDIAAHFLACRIAVDLGLLDRAEARLDAFRKVNRGVDTDFLLDGLRFIEGLLAHARGQHAAALAAYDEALPTLVEREYWVALDLHAQRARALHALGRTQAAREAIETGRDLVRQQQLEGGDGARRLEAAACDLA